MPSAAATRPSRLSATLATTNARPGAAVVEVRREIALGRGRADAGDARRCPRRAAGRSRARRPARRDRRPRRRPGSTPAAISASVHGGVLPWWSHGSSVQYAVAPRARSPAARSAATSACGPVGIRPGRALADDLAVAREDAADGRPRRGVTARGAGERDRPAHQLVVAHRVAHRGTLPFPVPGPRGAACDDRRRKRRRRTDAPSARTKW